MDSKALCAETVNWWIISVRIQASLTLHGVIFAQSCVSQCFSTQTGEVDAALVPRRITSWRLMVFVHVWTLTNTCTYSLIQQLWSQRSISHSGCTQTTESWPPRLTTALCVDHGVCEPLFDVGRSRLEGESWLLLNRTNCLW